MVENLNNNLFDLNDKVAIVTGGNKGLGKFYTIALASFGAKVFVVSSTQNGWDELREEFEKNNEFLELFQIDITTPNAAITIVNEAISRFGKIDILVNNAGMQRRNPIFEFNDKDWDEIIQLNLNAVYHLSKAVAYEMSKRKQGKIINIGSMQSFTAGKRIFPYTASKHGIAGLTKAYAEALAEYNIQVNTLSPGYIETDMTRVLKNDPVRGPEIEGHIPGGQWGEPKDLVGPLIFLASNASDYVTGVNLPVDGGYLLR
nr:SDR family NAD(P)-dependent oxidoreductase [Staphylococcus sp. EZ-P03]